MGDDIWAGLTLLQADGENADGAVNGRRFAGVLCPGVLGYLEQPAPLGIRVLGVRGRADTVEEVSELMRSGGVEPLRWYGVWLFVDWLEFSGAELDPGDSKQVAATAAVELEASRRDPYRQLSRVFHLLGRRTSHPSPSSC